MNDMNSLLYKSPFANEARDNLPVLLSAIGQACTALKPVLGKDKVKAIGGALPLATGLLYIDEAASGNAVTFYFVGDFNRVMRITVSHYSYARYITGLLAASKWKYYKKYKAPKYCLNLTPDVMTIGALDYDSVKAMAMGGALLNDADFMAQQGLKMCTPADVHSIVSVIECPFKNLTPADTMPQVDGAALSACIGAVKCFALYADAKAFRRTRYAVTVAPYAQGVLVSSGTSAIRCDVLLGSL